MTPTRDPHGPPASGGPFFLGLISGTSVDGIDAALVRFTPHLEIVAARTFPLAQALAQEVLRVSQSDAQLSLDDLGRLDTALGEAFAAAANVLIHESGIDRADIAAIGSHGQTLRHAPGGTAPFTMQVGDASVIAERTGIATVADFRRRDVAAGGQGAPLVPAFHAAVFAEAQTSCAVLNLGGIANLTLLPAHGPVRGFDTGPANGLMDAWCLHTRGELFDRGGAFAREGTVQRDLLARLLADPWLALPPPKSTGRDQFHLHWLRARLGDAAIPPADVQATLCEFTAVSVADALKREQPGTTTLLACGGGVHNAQLMDRLRAQLPEVRIDTTAARGLDPDFVEAVAFAWLAAQTLAGRPGNLPSVTGARGFRVLGSVHAAEPALPATS
ncbi:MAG: anhydro-N-acetylmuramic acid kinase [Arenimonas sp.]